MTRACHQPVRMATGDAFSDIEIDDMLDRMLRKAQRRGEPFDKAALAEAAQALTKEKLVESLAERRLKIASQRASQNFDRMLAGMDAVGDEADKLKAFNVGSERQGAGGSFSVDAEARARTVALYDGVEKGLREAGLMGRLTGLTVDHDFERAVGREMARLNGQKIDPTGDADALKVAEILNAATEKGRLMQNDVGAWIGRIEGYIGRQMHDPLRVAGGFWREFQVGGLGAVRDFKGAGLKASRKAFREWRDYTLPKLDDRTFEGIEARDLDGGWMDDARALQASGAVDDATNVREVMMYRMWSDIVAGKAEVLGGADDIGDFRPPASKARSVSKHRVMHFKDPDAWYDYHQTYGRGSMLSNVMGGLERAAKNSALMNRWGPSPDAMFKQKVGQLHAEAQARGDTGAAKRVMSAQRKAEFEEITGAGSAPESLRLAMVGRSIRMQQSLSKLGGMVLSGLSDTSLAAQTMKRAGAGYLDGYSGALAGISRMQSKEGKAAADLLSVGARSMAASVTGRFHAADGPMGWGSSLQRVFYKLNLFEAWSDGLRRGVAEMYSAHLGGEAAHPWDGLNAGTRETLERWGIDAQDWELARRGLIEPEQAQPQSTSLRRNPASEMAQDIAETSEPEGRRYWTFEAIDGIADKDLLKRAGLTGKEATPEAARRVREDLRLRFQAMVGGILDDALTEARARERVAITRGTRPGSVWGESVRAATQFWSFSAAIMGRHVAPAWRGYAGQKPVALLAHLIVASTLLGYASLQAKQIVKGREPRPLFDDKGEFKGSQLFMASLLQGGGLGIYGDFLFGEANRNGLGFTVGSLMGPSVGELERVASIVRYTISGDSKDSTKGFWDDRKDLPAKLIGAAKANIPMINLFYTRAALDYMVWYRLQEAASPGSVARMEKRVEKEENAKFFVSPSEFIGAR